MTQLQDALLLAALETQYRELGHCLERLRFARSTLIPRRAAVWHGAARRAFDLAVAGLTATVDTGVVELRDALERTDAAIAELGARA